MRVIKTIPHAACNITLYSWNGKFLIKFETANFEQTFKLPESHFNAEQVEALLTEVFIQETIEGFLSMRERLQRAIQHD